MTLAEKLFELRKSRAMSQQTLAELLEVSRQSVSKWESGSVMPDLDKVLLISKLFDVSTDCLLKDDIPLPESITAALQTSDGGEIDEADELKDDADAEATQDESFNLHFVGNGQYGEINRTPAELLADTAEVPPFQEQDADNESEEIREQAEETKAKKPRRLNKKALRVALIVFAVIAVLALAVPASKWGYDTVSEKIAESKKPYPYVLVHGLGGWGSEAGIDDVAHYWGASIGSLSEYLTQQGYEVCEPTVGPVSSAWDRACELYAQLTGTTVDYGAAHSAQNNHERYGRTYDKPLVEEWCCTEGGSKNAKINLVGHSFGGNTVRLLAHLLEYGAPEEVQAGSDDVSPLFKGGHGKAVNSVTTLCSPHNGSTLYYVLDRYNLTDVLQKLLYSYAGSASGDGKFYDFMLEQFGLDSKDANIDDKVTQLIENSKDTAAFDLSPDGAAVLNERIKTAENSYCFSYSWCTTQKSSLTGNQVPISGTLTILKATALMIGSYKENKATDYKIDETWLENDGLVSVVSAKYPFDEQWTPYDSESKIQRGIWYVMPVRTGDHGTVIGLNADVEATHSFYIQLFSMIDALKR